MPTLTRLIIRFAALAAIIYGAAYWLAHTVEPNQAEIIINIPAEQLQPQQPQ